MSDALGLVARRNRLAVVATLGLVAAVLGAVLAPWLPLVDPDAVDTVKRLQPPLSPGHVLGTDEFGRDLLSRLVWGARVSLLAGVATAAAAMLIGVLLGILGGFYSGWVENLVMRLTDILMAFPYVLLAIVLVAGLGPGLRNAMIAIAIVGFPIYTRLVRGVVLTLREREFVEAAHSLGAGDARIMFVDVLPNVLAPVIVYTTLLIPVVIVVQATLSFLGLGLAPPTADWGGMLSESQAYYTTAWWFIVFPGAALLVTTLAFNLFGDGVRDAFDPRRDR
jgi:ABC-type dipeptide/oligopeptide/nickel transport system permease subunit